MNEAEEILDKGHMTETFIQRQIPEGSIIQRGHTEDKTIIEMEVTVDNGGLDVIPDH